jgi:DNA (cytosine-5)-methyltransferase 1
MQLANQLPIPRVQASVAPNIQDGPTIVLSLFCGAGGLDLGFELAGYDVRLSIDRSPSAIATHRKNFGAKKSVEADLDAMGPEGVCEALKQRVPLGARIGIIGGPPCQGFSRANTGSYTTDPRNSLVELYVRIIQRLNRDFIIDFVVFENVLGIKDRKHRLTFESLQSGLENIGLSVTSHECCALDHDVPQTRRRVLVTGIAKEKGPLTKIPHRPGKKTIRESIGHLRAPVYFRHGLLPDEIPIHPNHWTSRPRSKRFSTPLTEWKPTRSFKRTYWSKPSPTIAFGHREIHVHPCGKRRLSIYEAMLIQGFPETFVLTGNLTQQVEQVSNAVPPPLAYSVAESIRLHLCGEVPNA